MLQSQARSAAAMYTICSIQVGVWKTPGPGNCDVAWVLLDRDYLGPAGIQVGSNCWTSEAYRFVILVVGIVTTDESIYFIYGHVDPEGSGSGQLTAGDEVSFAPRALQVAAGDRRGRFQRGLRLQVYK